MKVIFLGNDFGVFESTAASNLIRCISRGISKCNIETHVVGLGLEYGISEGKIDEVRYYIPLKQRRRNKNLFVRLFHRFILRRFNLMFYLLKHARKSDTICIVYSEKIGVYLTAFIYKPLFKKIILYAVEHPFREFPPASLRHISERTYRFIISRIFDGAICVSHYLKGYYSGFLKNDFIVIPAVVDPSSFECAVREKTDFEYICYCGSVTKLKDGVDLLITAFTEVTIKFKELRLLIIGGFYPPDGSEEEFIKIVKDSGISDRVVFTGKIDRGEIPSYYSNAKLLVFPRPSSIQAKAGFSTKLAEYLASGRPVVASAIGDVPVYISDNEAFLFRPGDVDDLVNKLVEALTKEEISRKKGISGRILADTKFHYLVQGRRLADFLSEITLQT